MTPDAIRLQWRQPRLGFALVGGGILLVALLWMAGADPAWAAVIGGTLVLVGCERCREAPRFAGVRRLATASVIAAATAMCLTVVGMESEDGAAPVVRIAVLSAVVTVTLLLLIAARITRAANTVRATRAVRILVGWALIGTAALTVHLLIHGRPSIRMIGTMLTGLAGAGFPVALWLAARAAHRASTQTALAIPLPPPDEPDAADQEGVPLVAVPTIPGWWPGRAIAAIGVAVVGFLGWAGGEPIAYDAARFEALRAERNAGLPAPDDCAWADICAIDEAFAQNAPQELQDEFGWVRQMRDYHPVRSGQLDNLAIIRSFDESVDPIWQRMRTRQLVCVLGPDGEFGRLENFQAAAQWRLIAALADPERTVQAFTDVSNAIVTCTRGNGGQFCWSLAGELIDSLEEALGTLLANDRLTGAITLDHLERIDRVLANTIERMGHPEDGMVRTVLFYQWVATVLASSPSAARTASESCRWMQWELDELLLERDLATSAVAARTLVQPTTRWPPDATDWEQFRIGLGDEDSGWGSMLQPHQSYRVMSRDFRRCATRLRLLRIACRIEASYRLVGSLPATLSALADPGWKLTPESVNDEWLSDGSPYLFGLTPPSRPTDIPVFGYQLASAKEGVKFEVLPPE